MKKIIILSCLTILSLGLIGCNENTSTTNNNKDVNVNSSNNVKVVEVEKQLENDEQNNMDANKESNNINNVEEENNNQINNTDNNENNQNNQIEANLTLYFPSTEYIVEGNEEHKSIEKETLLQTTEDHLAEDIIYNLKNSTPPEGAESCGLENYSINNITQNNNEVTIDFSSNNLNGGSLDEDILIRSIVNSLLSTNYIDSVTFTVDGESSESLMGHIDISESFTNPY